MKCQGTGRTWYLPVAPSCRRDSLLLRRARCIYSIPRYSKRLAWLPEIRRKISCEMMMIVVVVSASTFRGSNWYCRDEWKN
ncbi:hypothetical protein BDZ85DRAFT_255037 [Elsinoe ampelina]|uniref:Uncharacterized protein n=1 Tax=Elsinoe ampelina TaxID=302913 RepID=A0A6A6GQJ9_9PEZI|nr:hypothetical protein BDZ85DRAFT_255037 [Elsinoe ampelina]